MNENTPIPPVGNANSGTSEAELVALLEDVRAYWGSVETHLLDLIGHARSGRPMGDLVRRPATFTYEADVLDLHLAQGVPRGPVARTVEMTNALVLTDLDAQGRVLGLEIIGPFPFRAVVATAPTGDAR